MQGQEMRNFAKSAYKYPSTKYMDHVPTIVVSAIPRLRHLQGLQKLSKVLE